MERRTQADRSAATRQVLIDAAIGLLQERGWAATTAVAVCERAGVTRGALIHHFPSLSALLAHALESLYAEISDTPTPVATTMAGLLDTTWRALGDPRFKAVIEAWMAAGNDAELATEIGPAIARFSEHVSTSGSAIKTILRDADAKAFYLMAREAMLGLALGRATGGGKPLGHERAVLARLRRDAVAYDTPAETTRRQGR